jgi:predicted GIY-YIG superfamily endonuclease
MIKKNSKSDMKSLEETVKEIGRRYVEQRKEIAIQWQFEFDTKENREIMNSQIKQLENSYKEELRQKKLEHLLDDTLFRK